MVDDLDISRRIQYAQQAQPSAGVQLINPVEEAAKPMTVRDAVNLSSQASGMLKSMREFQQGMTVAEAWLRNKIEPPDLADLRQLEKSSQSSDSNNSDKEQQESLSRSFDQTMNDISWLLDAIGVNKVDSNPIADAIAEKAARSGVGVAPPLPEILARAQQAGSVAALFVENIDVTLQRNRVIDVSVERVTITQIHDSVGDRFAGTDKPLVLDVGGELQQVRIPSVGSGNDAALTPTARSIDNKAARVAEALTENNERPEDLRRALLIVREGGKLMPEGTVRVKLDTLMPIR